MASPDQRAHAARLGERQRLAIVDRGTLGIEPVRVGCHIREQVQGIGRESVLRRGECERPLAEALRVVEPAKRERGVAEEPVA